MSDALDDYLAHHEEDAVALLSQLCRQPSIAAQGVGIGEMADLVERLLRETGFTTRRLTAEGAPPLIYGELRGSSPYTVLLYDHYDVQPAEPLELWESPPFEPTVREGKLFARGTEDDKGGFAARLAAIRALRAVRGELPLTLRWIVEGEEEVGSPHFEAIIASAAELLRADGCLWEASGFDIDGRPGLTYGTKGLLYVQLDAAGTRRDAHSGMAPILPSAAWQLVQALGSLRDASGRVRIPGFYDRVRPPDEAARAALSQLPRRDEQMREAYGVERFTDDLAGTALLERLAYTPTCNIAGLESGYTGAGSKTVLPGHAMAKLDFRLVPDQDPHAILAGLRAHLEAQGYGAIQITTFAAAEPVTTPLDDPFAARVAQISAAFAGKPPTVMPLAGGTLPFLGALRRLVGVPGLTAPGKPSYWDNRAHSPNEHIRLADLEQAVRFNCYLFEHLAE